MDTEVTEKRRGGKYCPRCHVMTERTQTVCPQCGHQFRTGVEPAETAGGPGPDPMNRTMQFTLPPQPPRTPVPAPAPPPSAWRLPTEPRPARAWPAAALVLLSLCAGVGLLWHTRRTAPVSAQTPVGVWETTLRGKASAMAHLEFALMPDSTGRFSWRESGSAPLSGRTALRWRVSSDQRLTLLLTPPAAADPVSQTLVGIFSNRPWHWRVEGSPRRLVLGTLVLTEKL